MNLKRTHKVPTDAKDVVRPSCDSQIFVLKSLQKRRKGKDEKKYHKQNMSFKAIKINHSLCLSSSENDDSTFPYSRFTRICQMNQYRTVQGWQHCASYA